MRLYEKIAPDPADPSRLLIKRVNQVADGKWAYEEIRMGREDSKSVPTLHATMHRLHYWDLYSKFDPREESVKRIFRASPTVVSFSLFYNQVGDHPRNPALSLTSMLFGGHGVQYTIVENILHKESQLGFREWFNDLQDKRDMSTYLRNRMRWAI